MPGQSDVKPRKLLKLGRAAKLWHNIPSLQLLRAIIPDELSPKQALDELYELKNAAEKETALAQEIETPMITGSTQYWQGTVRNAVRKGFLMLMTMRAMRHGREPVPPRWRVVLR